MLVAVKGAPGNTITFFTACRTCFLHLASSINICVSTCMCQCLSETGLPNTLTPRGDERRDVPQKTDTQLNTLLAGGQCYCVSVE